MDSNKSTWNWRDYFSESTLRLGQNDFRSGKVRSFECDSAGSWARCVTSGNYNVRVLQAPTTYAKLASYPAWTILSVGATPSGPRAFNEYYLCSCSSGSIGQRCRHLASLMFCWEQAHGPFVFVENAEEQAIRLKKERKKREKKVKQDNKYPAIDFILKDSSPQPEGLYYQPDTILQKTELMTDQYEAEQAEALLAAGREIGLQLQSVCSPGQKQILQAVGTCGNATVHLFLRQNSIAQLNCSCGHSYLPSFHYWHNSDRQQGRMCSHALAVWKRVRERIIRDNPGDETDYTGFQFLELMTDDSPDQVPTGPVDEKRSCVELVPRITRDKNNNTLKLCFDIGHTGERSYAVRGLEGLVQSVSQESVYAATKTVSINFSSETFTPAANEWFQLILSRIRSVQRVNDRLSRSFYNVPTLSVGSGIPLEESDLDVVYDMVAGGTIQYQYGSRAEVCSVRVGEAMPRTELTLSPVLAGNRLAGISVSGAMPRLLRGNLHQYILDKTCFGRVAGEDASLLDSLQEITDGAGSFLCTIGERKLAEFYYRVLPSLQGNPQITVVDKVGSLVEGLIPTQPRFTFHLDLADNITCDTRVSYDDFSFKLGAPEVALPPGQRDIDQELRVMAVLRQLFPEADHARQILYCPADDDLLAWILTDGVAMLSQYGEVMGSDAFKRVRVIPAPQPRVSVQVEGGLLDLSIQTKDMTEDELLELLSSYRLKKRWHRLRSGDFVDLRNTSALNELDETAQAMDVSVEALVRGGVQMPKYRALYVDKLLEEHDKLAASRNRLFKSLIRSFQTIKDSDFEASESLMEALRPYQLYGFRWLSTLSQAGFGGILADEMGLGKTVQMLAYLQQQRDQGETKPALVVCPASLVYNWKDECRKFTPEMTVETLAGTLRQRKALMKDMSADVYVTSYDLLKRDIALYDGLSFSVVVLDEAQYIKNQKAAVSKAVRVLKADHRFALTGTPIENRLSELWSIFDFLMPGFLYSASEFGARFEAPIMKQKSAEATAKLARMTSPFILRRQKADVLKDLPEKLEEARSSRMEEDQRRLYDAQLVRMRSLLESSGDSGEDKMRILAEITRLRQICCDPSLIFDNYSGTSAKRAACLELIQNAMDAGHRMLVFSQFTSMLALLEADLKATDIPFFKLTGSTPKLERLRLVNAFNEGDVPVFLISLKAGGTGLNLTGADVVIHYDPWWNLAVQNQATDRAHRIGQTRQVTVVKLIAANTIEERILRLQETKRALADAIISGENTSLMSLSREELLELLE